MTDEAEKFLDGMDDMTAALRKFRVDIEAALGYGGHSHSFANVVAMCVTGEVDLYILPSSVIMMQLTDYPNYKSYHAFIAAGDLDEIIEAQNGLLIREARLRGASKLTLAGRRGWARALKSEGWEDKLVIMHKDVPNEQNITEQVRSRSRPASGGELGANIRPCSAARWLGLSAV